MHLCPLFYAGDEPEDMMQACLQIMARVEWN